MYDENRPVIRRETVLQGTSYDKCLIFYIWECGNLYGDPYGGNILQDVGCSLFFIPIFCSFLDLIPVKSILLDLTKCAKKKRPGVQSRSERGLS